ncbi:MAG: carboxypeptidase regulatory-like domain-containing protein, partial [Gemmatimonadales bacterium]
LHLRVVVEGTQFDSTVVSPMLTGSGLARQWGLSAFVRPLPRKPLFFFDAAVDRVETGSLVSTRARIGASFQGDAVRLLPFLRFERLAPAGLAAMGTTYAGVNAFILPRTGGGAGKVLRGALIRANFEMAGLDSLMSASVFLSRRLWTGVRFESGLLWTRAAVGNPTLQVIVSSYLPSVRLVTSTSMPRGATATGSQYVQGSVLWDGTANRVRLAPGPSLERAGLTGRVFFDANANGIRDADEPGLPDVRVRIATTVAATDSNGELHVWDLVPFEPVMVVLDSLSLENPLWVPAYATVSVVPGPNRFRTLDLPVVQGGELEGRVLRAGDGREGLGGVTLVLTDVVTGARRTVVTFTDGTFYLLGLKPGSYRVTVDERALQALGMTADPTAFQLRLGATSVEPVEIRLKPRSSP